MTYNRRTNMKRKHSIASIALVAGIALGMPRARAEDNTITRPWSEWHNKRPSDPGAAGCANRQQEEKQAKDQPPSKQPDPDDKAPSRAESPAPDERPKQSVSGIGEPPIYPEAPAHPATP
jgi:hypothetical protein